MGGLRFALLTDALVALAIVAALAVDPTLLLKYYLADTSCLFPAKNGDHDDDEAGRVAGAYLTNLIAVLHLAFAALLKSRIAKSTLSLWTSFLTVLLSKVKSAWSKVTKAGSKAHIY